MYEENNDEKILDITSYDRKNMLCKKKFGRTILKKKRNVRKLFFVFLVFYSMGPINLMDLVASDLLKRNMSSQHDEVECAVYAQRFAKSICCVYVELRWT